MSFNRQNEYKRFIAKQVAQAKEYSAIGMTKQEIERFLDYDKQQFLSDMRFYSHNQSLNCSTDDFDDENNPLLKKYFDRFIVADNEYITDKLDVFDNYELVSVIASMNKVNQQIVFYLMDGFTLHEIAEKTSIGYWGVVKRVQQIRKELKPIMNSIFPEAFISANDADDMRDFPDVENRTFVGGGENE